MSSTGTPTPSEGTLFIVTMEFAEPPPSKREQLLEFESQRAAELAQSGSLQKLWRVQGRWANVGIWRAADIAELNEVIDSLPLRPWITLHIDALESHPSDPRSSILN